MKGALEGVRVLDLTGFLGMYCTKLLALAGAEVIKVEPPTGDPGRSIGPFFGETPHPNESLFFFHFHLNKKSITLDLGTPEGVALFKRLADRVDVVVESFAPGFLSRLDAGYEALKRSNPRLVYTAITPFGQEGPRAHWKASDLTLQAMGGVLTLNGEMAGPPVGLGALQAYHAGGAYAAAATGVALYYRGLIGEGQMVDVSIQECVAPGQQEALPSYQTWERVKTRRGSQKASLGFGIYPCKDGYIFLQLIGDVWGALTAWLGEHALGEELAEEAWSDPEFRNKPESTQRFDVVFADFTARFTREELFLESLRRRIPMAPVQHAQDLLADPQLQFRQFFVPVSFPELGQEVLCPGPPFRFSETPAALRQRAPLLAEHNGEVYKGLLGLTREDVAALRSTGII
ncbi:MAG: CoA transferase [Chloroflexi bacterium]|nr:CoA transferase [Chloroflexota bacterium]